MRVRDRLVGESGPKGLYMCHGFCELGAVPFDSALAQFRGFLVAHPYQVVLVVIEDTSRRRTLPRPSTAPASRRICTPDRRTVRSRRSGR